MSGLSFIGSVFLIFILTMLAYGVMVHCLQDSISEMPVIDNSTSKSLECNTTLSLPYMENNGLVIPSNITLSTHSQTPSNSSNNSSTVDNASTIPSMNAPNISPYELMMGLGGAFGILCIFLFPVLAGLLTDYDDVPASTPLPRPSPEQTQGIRPQNSSSVRSHRPAEYTQEWNPHSWRPIDQTGVNCTTDKRTGIVGTYRSRFAVISKNMK